MKFLERINLLEALVIIFTINFVALPNQFSAGVLAAAMLCYGAVKIFTGMGRTDDLEIKVAALKTDMHAMLVDINTLKATHQAVTKQAEETKKVLSSGNLQAAFVPRNKRTGATPS